ncbi:MAG: hypothetical protein IKY82_05815 [Alistipes sp.]|nr:hypothetical protein [Alistipes sp.]
MKSLKIFFLTALVAVASMFTACTNDQDWSAGEQAQGAQVYFSADAVTTITATAETTSFDVVVYRGNTEGAVSVPVKATISAAKVDEDAEPIDYTELFSIPTKVSFGEGKDKATLKIEVDRENLEDGQTYTIALQLNDASAVTPYGYSSQTYTFVVPEPYVLLGKAVIREDIIATIFSIDNIEWEVEVYENANTPGYIYLKNAYTSKFPYNEPGDYVEEDVYFTINISDPTQVVIPTQYLGCDWNPTDYGPFFVGTAAPGTLVNGVITFPVKGLLLGMEIYTEGQWGWYANTNGLFRVILPGAVLTDYSMEVAYGGFRVADDNATIYPIARAAYGADVAEIKYAFVAGDITSDVEALEAALAGIEDGSVVSNKVAVTTTTNADGEEVNEMMLESVEAKEAGVYTVIAIPYSADGEAQYGDLAIASFYVQGVGAGELPEVDLELAWMPFSEAMPDYSEKYPDSSTWYCEVYGSEIKSMRYFFHTTAQVDAYLAAGYTAQDLVDLAGEDFDVSYINAEGGDYIMFTGVPAATSFTVVVWAENSYGNTTILTASGSTAEAAAAKLMGSAKLSWKSINGNRIAFSADKAFTFTPSNLK